MQVFYAPSVYLSLSLYHEP